jgi:hypothetical protein
VKCLVQDPHSPLAYCKDALGETIELHHLLASHDSDIVFLTLDIFLSLHQNDYLSFVSLENHINVMLPFFSVGCSDTFVGRVIILSSLHSEFLTICFYVCCCNDSEGPQDILMKNLRKQAISTSALFWAMRCYISQSSSFGQFLVRYLLSCDVPLQTIFVSIDVLSNIFEIDAPALKTNCLMIIASELTAVSDYGLKKTFLELALAFLLFRDGSCHAPALLSCYKVFGCEMESSPPRSPPSLRGKQDMMIHKLNCAAAVRPAMTFGIRLDTNSQWIDAKLGEICADEWRRRTVDSFKGLYHCSNTFWIAVISLTFLVIKEFIHHFGRKLSNSSILSGSNSDSNVRPRQHL